MIIYKKLLLLFLVINLGYSLSYATPIQSDHETQLENIEVIKMLFESIDNNGLEDYRFETLKNLSDIEFAQLLSYLFAPEGGSAIKHWAYNPTFSTSELSDHSFYQKPHNHPLGFEPDYFYITPPTITIQYILFFLEYKATDDFEKRERAKKVANSINLLKEENAVNLLYGRFDTRFVRENDKITPEIQLPKKIKSKATLKDKFTRRLWLFEKLKINENSQIYEKQNDSIFYRNTIRARLPLPFVRLLIPYLNQELLNKMMKKEDYLSSQKLRVEL